jgi:hypothetical protein
LTFAAVFTVIGGVLFWRGREYYPSAFIVAAVFLLVSYIRPDVLGLPNRLWAKFGERLHNVVNPIVMGVIYFGFVTPFAIVVRYRGQDSMKMKFDTQASTYWIERQPPGPNADSFTRQF